MPTGQVRPAPPSIVGRDTELAHVTRFLRRGGTDRALVVDGDAGVGKTALSRVVAHQEKQRGATVLSAVGVEAEVDIGFACLTQLLAPVVDRVDHLAPQPRSHLYAAMGYDEPAPGRAPQVTSAVVALLTLLSETAPVTLIVDDLQWTDPATAEVLGHAARSVGVADVRFIVLERTGTHSFFDTSGFPRLRVGPLPEAAAEALVQSRYPRLDRTVLARVLDESAGNPLALLEMPEGLSPSQRTADDELPVHLPLSERLQGLYGGRILSLPPATRHLLLVTALGGAEVGRLGPDWSERLRLLLPAERAGLLELDRADGRVRFPHPLVRSTVIELSTSQERRQAHTVLAAGAAVDDERAAWHRAAAALAPDEAVAGSLEAAAGRALRRGDASGAVRTLVRAAELSPVPAGRARRLTRAAYLGAAVGGDLRRAARLLDDADEADPGTRQTLEAATATAHLLLNGGGDTLTAHRVLVAALEAAAGDSTVDVQTVAEAVHTLGEICMYAAQPALWPAYEEALSRLPLERLPVLALWHRLVVDPARGARAALPALEEALRGLADERDPVRVERIATAAAFVDRVELARRPLLRLVEDARAGTSVASGVLALILLSSEHLHRGRWAELRASAAEGVRLVDEHGLDLFAWPLKRTLACLAAVTGDQAGLQVICEQMHAWATPRQVGAVLHYAHHAAGLDALGRGDYETAFRELSQVSPAGDLAGNVGPALWTAMDLVEAAVNAGYHEAAAAHVLAMRRAGVGELSDRLRLVAAGSEAMAGEPLDRALYDRALAVPGADEWPFELARIRLSYGQRLRRGRAVAAARPHLEAALRTFVDLGARPWAARAQLELGATNQTRQPSDASGAEARLTPQEHHVATMAGQGLTNKQIADQMLISPRTVGAHLQSVYRKLAVAGRGGLHHALATPDRSRATTRSG